MSIKKDRRAWWQYCAQCVMSAHRKARAIKMEQISWQFIEGFKERNSRYAQLYKRKMRPSSLSNWLPVLDDDEKAEISKMEDTLPTDQILVFRSVAMAELKKQMQKREEFQTALKAQKSEAQKNNYAFIRVFQAAATYLQSVEERPDEYKLTSDEKNGIIKQLNLDRTMQQMKLPDNYVQNRFGLNLNGVSFDLMDGKSCVATLFIACKTQIQMKPRSKLIGVAIQTLELKPGMMDAPHIKIKQKKPTTK